MKISKLTILNHINLNYRQYAVYTLQHRGIPNFYDSLTNVQRIILLNTPLKSTKTLSVVGDCIKNGNYHHGDCLEYDTEINLADDSKIKIGDWAEKYPNAELIVKCVDENNNSVFSVAHSPRIGQTTNEYYEIELENGEIIKCTKNHPFLIDNKFVKAENLKINDNIVEFSDPHDDI